MNIQQLKKEIADLRGLFKPADEFEGVIIYDPDQGVPEFNDGKMRICLPDNGRDQVLIYLPEDGRDC